MSLRVTDYILRTAELFRAAGLHFGHGTDNALDEAVYLVYSSLGISFTDHENDKSAVRELNSAEILALDDRVRRRVENREPVAYIVGEAWFCGLPFFADTRALIPRSPIAELIGHRFSGLLVSEPERILDMCAGGGCIGIASALAFPRARVDLADVSRASLELARENCERHGVMERVRLLRSHLFTGLEGHYDLILANPPYVAEQELRQLPAEYHHEPPLGLQCEDEGLALALSILHESGQFLSSQGMLILEVGNNAEALQQQLHPMPILWLEFEHGGHGVLAISAAELEQLPEY